MSRKPVCIQFMIYAYTAHIIMMIIALSMLHTLWRLTSLYDHINGGLIAMLHLY